jgi:predicted naringenin-chalcone synthase
MRSIATAVPRTTFSQPVVRDVFAQQPDLGRLAKRLIGAAFDASGIERRHTVIEELDFEDRPGDSVFYDSASGRMLSPGTRVRNELYIAQAAPLFLEAGRKALEACPELRPEDVTHVITVSCTGFYAPGLPGRARARPCDDDTALPHRLHGLLRRLSRTARGEGVL